MLSEHKPALVAPGKAVTQHDIARVCGLHQSAVSFALRGDTTHVTPETMARVQAVAAELGYAPHQAARKMVAVRFGKTIINHLIALCFPRDFHRNPYFLEPYLGVMDALADAGFDLLTLAVTGELSADFLANSPAVARGDVDAIIAFSIPAMIHSLHEQARALPAFGARPFIALIQPMTDCSTVLYDDEQAAYEIGCHLLALGHRHLLALMVPYAFDIWQRRLVGFQRACATYGLEANNHLHQLFIPTTDWINPALPSEALPPLFLSINAAFEYTDAFTLPDYLRAHPEITAVAAWNDACAQHIWRVTAAMGWRIPADLSLTGFDDDEILFDETGQKSLTTVRLPFQRLGEEAVRLAIARVTGHLLEDQHVLLPCTLIARASTAPPTRA